MVFLKRVCSYRKLAAPAMSLFLDEFAIQMYNPQTDIEGVLSVMRKAYMRDSNTFIVYDLNNSVARQEYDDFFLNILNDGLSVVARYLPTDQIVGYCLNNIQSRPEPGEPMFFGKCLEKYNDPNFRNYLASRAKRDEEINLFQKYDCDHIFEMVNLTTLAEFRGKQIGYNLVNCSVEIAKSSAIGVYPKTTHTDFLGKKPGLVFASCSSLYSTKIMQNHGFSIIRKIPFSDKKVNGVSEIDKVAPQHTHTSLVVLKL